MPCYSVGRVSDPEVLAGELLALISRLRRRLHEESRHDDYTPSQVAVILSHDWLITGMRKCAPMPPRSALSL